MFWTHLIPYSKTYLFGDLCSKSKTWSCLLIKSNYSSSIFTNKDVLQILFNTFSRSPKIDKWWFANAIYFNYRSSLLVSFCLFVNCWLSPFVQRRFCTIYLYGVQQTHTLVVSITQTNIILTYSLIWRSVCYIKCDGRFVSRLISRW